MDETTIRAAKKLLRAYRQLLQVHGHDPDEHAECAIRTIASGETPFFIWLVLLDGHEKLAYMNFAEAIHFDPDTNYVPMVEAMKRELR